MKMLVTGVAMSAVFALAAPAGAAPGQCSMTGYGDFSCDVAVDGGGISFVLPDRQVFVFAHQANSEGFGYLIEDRARAGARPDELGAFAPIEGEPGCWFGPKDEITFCAALKQ
ncbi:hypothetical protein [Devosia rhizoryzae]|uniref:Uncharacterized protein n=1 Tax=Devosia rhizoryzae TaxID=2774137 RepID=A0ABX7C7G6_9HYPH|nr:hypothetical protein [Devosia rhizoryzae]QQR40156.1 hypothetical protein JI748_03845 [Devosia rhizoryzae]